MTEVIQSPQDVAPGQVVNLAGVGKVWRKQVLPLDSINYQGRQIKFDANYHKELVRNFRAGAYGQVPFQLADATNQHTNDPERTRGELVDLRAEPDGLYAYVNLTNPELVKNNPKLGVSCRIVEDYTRESDGKYFGKSLQHVLGTLDPRIVDMKPWEAVALASAPASSTIDLSGQFYTKDGGEMPDGTSTEDKHVVELSTAQLERLNQLLAEDDDKDEETEDGDDLFAGMSDEDLAGLLQDDPEDEDEQQQDGASVGLAVTQNLQAQVLELTNRLNGREAEFELEQLAATGLAPAIIECARPLLAIRSGVIELANGEKVSPSQQVRKLLQTVLDLAHKGTDLIDFDLERGSQGGADSAQAIRKSQVDEMARLYGS
jgi:hypothetical protein